MRASSIFSSDVRRRWAVGAVLTALLLAGAEGLLRVPSIQSRLPTRTHYYNSGVVIREDALKRTLAVDGHVDVLFIGSSIVRTNIQPLTYDALTTSGGCGRLVSFNAGLSGLWPSAVALYLEHVWLRLAKPRLVVQGIRYPELAATTHALRPDQVFSGTVEAGWANATWSERLYGVAAANLRLLQYRGALGGVLQRYVNGRPGPISTEDAESVIDPRGYTPRLPTLREAKARGAAVTLEPIGEEVCARDGCRVGFEALRRAIASTHRSDADYVLVNIPEHSTRWGGRDGQRRYRDYLAAVQDFAESNGVPFIDPTDGNSHMFEDDEEYSDLYHMSPAGAERLTSILAARIDLRLFTDSTGRCVTTSARYRPGTRRKGAGLKVHDALRMHDSRLPQ
jgi:hypothetical protein